MQDEDLSIRFSPLAGGFTQRKTEHRKGKTFGVDYARALKHLRRELIALEPRGPVVVQVDVPEHHIRADQTGLKSEANPGFPGVRLTINSNKRGTLSYQRDAYKNWRENLRAIGLTLERLRLVERDGVANDGQQYRGWKALPAPEHADVTTIDTAATFLANWSQGGKVAEYSMYARVKRDAAYAAAAYKAAVKYLHPDSKTGHHTENRWQMLQAAWGLIEQMHSASGAGR